MITPETQGAVTVLMAAGSINAENAEQLVESVTEQASRGLPQLVLDLSQVALVDSAGLEAVLDCRAAVRSKGGVLKLAGPRPLVDDILVATGVGDHFEVFPSAKSAVGSFSR